MQAIPIPRCARGCPREKRLPGLSAYGRLPHPLPTKTAKREGGPPDAAVLAPKTKKPPLRTASLTKGCLYFFSASLALRIGSSKSL